MGTSDRTAGARSDFRLPAQVSAGYVSQSDPTVASPRYRRQSRRGNNAPKRNQGWRREFRISQRFAVIDAAVSRPERRRPPRRDRRLGRVSPGRRDAPSMQSRGDRNCVARRMGIRVVSLSTRRPAHLPHRLQQSKREIMDLKRNRDGRQGPRISHRAMGIAHKTPGLQGNHAPGE